MSDLKVSKTEWVHLTDFPETLKPGATGFTRCYGCGAPFEVGDRIEQIVTERNVSEDSMKGEKIDVSLQLVHQGCAIDAIQEEN